MKTILLTSLSFLVCITAWMSCKKRDSNTVRAAYCNATGPMIYQRGMSELILPDAFTPNGDGKNDVFRPLLKNIDTASYSLTVVQGLDAVYFHTTDPAKGWGEPGSTAATLGPGLYEVSIHFKTADGTEVDGCNFVSVLGTDAAKKCIVTNSSTYHFEDQADPANPAAGFKYATSEVICP